MASTDAKLVPTKNAAYRVTFPILDADGDLVTGATALDSEVSKDGAAFADCTNEATEIATSSGIYYLDLTSTEMNADTVCVIVKTSSSGAKTTVLTFYPQESGDLIANATQVGGTTQTAGDLASLITTVDDLIDTEVAAIKTKTDFLPSATAGAAGGLFIAGSNAATTVNITGNLSGSVGSVTGAVGSVTGAVGSVTGSVGSITTGGIAATSFAAGAIDAAALAASAGTEIAAAVLAAAAADPIDANIEQINTVTIVGDGSATPFNV